MINLSAILILAGGESRRMGSPKALLPLPNGENLLQYHIRHAKQLAKNLNKNIPILIGDNDKNFSLSDDIDVIAIQDYINNAGALSCLLSAFYYCQNCHLNDGFILVISCDNLINIDELYFKLCDNIINSQAIYLTDSHLTDSKDYPLLGLYNLNLIDELKTYLDNDNRAVMKFLKDKLVEKISMNDNWRYMANFNTLDEFKLALKCLTE